MIRGHIHLLFVWNFKHLTFDFYLQRYQVLTSAWTRNTVSVLNSKQSTVGCALNQFTGAIEELIRNPVQVNAGMRTNVVVTENIVAQTYSYHLYFMVISLEAQALTTIFRY